MGSTGDDYSIQWQTTDAEACDLCQDHEGDNPYSLDTLPGWPGDGEFGGPVCLGGPNCRCTLIYSDASGNAATSRDEPIAAGISTDLTKVVPGGSVKAAATPGQQATCPCGTPAVYDVTDGWQHADGSVSHDDGESVSEKMNREAAPPQETSLPGRQRVSPGAYNPAELPPMEFQLNRVFRALDPDAVRFLSIGDRLVDEEPVEFAVERPDAPLVAVVKSLQIEWASDTIFRVTAIREDEVELEPVG
jgi:hypothetical protein